MSRKKKKRNAEIIVTFASRKGAVIGLARKSFRGWYGQIVGIDRHRILAAGMYCTQCYHKPFDQTFDLKKKE